MVLNLLHEYETGELPHEIDPKNNIRVVLENKITGKKRFWYGSNIVTNDGDIYYAKKGAGETPATNENFLAGKCILQNPGSSPTTGKADTWQTFAGQTPIAASIDSLESGYPKANDQASDNDGKNPDAVTYKYYWDTTNNWTGIFGGCIVDQVYGSLVNASKLLTHWAFAAAFAKTSNDTLTLYVNHTMNGIP
jgi:hypothetical protein